MRNKLDIVFHISPCARVASSLLFYFHQILAINSLHYFQVDRTGMCVQVFTELQYQCQKLIDVELNRVMISCFELTGGMCAVTLHCAFRLDVTTQWQLFILFTLDRALEFLT